MLLTEHIFSWCKMEQKLKWNFSFKTYTPCIKRRRIAGLVIQKKVSDDEDDDQLVL